MKKPPATEYGVADPDGLDREWTGEDLDSLEGKSGETEMKTDELAMQHTCASCGADNEVLPPLGFTLKRTGKATEVEREIDRAFSDLEDSFQLQEAWRRAYAAARKRPRCPAPLIGA